MKDRQGHSYRFIRNACWVILFFSGSLFSQGVGELKRITAAKFSTEEKIAKIDSLILLYEKEKNDSLEYVYERYADWLYDVRGLKSAIPYLNKTLDLATSRPVKDSTFIQNSALFLAFCYNINKQYHKSIAASREVLLINDKNRAAVRTYDQLGFAYSRIPDYYKSLENYELYASLIRVDEKRIRSLRKAHKNIIAVCLDINTAESFRKGLKYAMTADSLSSVYPIDSATLYETKLNLATLYNQYETLDIGKAFGYYNEALEIAKKVKDTSKIRDIYMLIGNLFNQTEPDRSLEYLEKALVLAEPEKDPFNSYQIYSNISFTHGLNEEYEKSLEYTHKSLEYLIGDNLRDHKSINRNLFINSDYKENLLNALPKLGETYLKYYEKTGDPEFLDKSIHYFKETDYVIDLLKINSREFRSRLFWRKLSTDIYGKAIRACYLKGNIEDTFYFMEKNKALLLQEDINTQQFKKSLELPDSIIRREETLRRKLFGIENALKETKEVTVLDSLKKELIDRKRELSILQDSIGPKEGVAGLEPIILDLDAVKKKIKEDEVVLEYHISIDDGYGIYTNREKGYLLMITQSETRLFEIPDLPSLKEEITSLLRYFESPFRTNGEISDFTALSNRVFKRLLPSEEIRLSIKNKKLTIVPDSYLSLLPFEALSVSEDKLSYLIRDCDIHYLYSNSFLEGMERSKHVENNFLGVAPSDFNDKELLPLQNNKQELLSLEQYYRGRSLISGEASKENFLEALSGSGIIHLATHANAEESSDPWIAFNDEKLKLEELYLTANNASLVVLSGCNTSLGKLETGEGVMSLARGFFYSGSRSVISSLWSIDDKSTSFIVDEFYRNTSSGQSKSQALRNAKLKYLDTYSHSEASPHYWASLILLGEDDLLKGTPFNWIPYLLIAALLLIFFIAFRYFRR
ncbi:CHAT domain-containing protein [Leptobacterium flavescens]|uniref:CHAT domain-containing protein n=1 Tax=Leptobacterium flavescens TaxID=472055 RepID=A0A6P0UPX1_9FLAO|nr:CHAT domain-containing protein [Leptobacterium flavescens]NER14520.1 CHAT domain-containing protein [Leptobacterium flavescens]